MKKQFSNLCLQQKNAYYDSPLNELISCSTNSNTFLLKQKNQRPTLHSNISNEQWRTHFESLFNSDQEVQSNVHELNLTEELFNGVISDDEIVRAVKSLKHGKSGGFQEDT